MLVRHGAIEDASTLDRLLAACLRDDRTEATRLVSVNPGLTDSEYAALVHAADQGNIEAVRLMLDQGFDVNTPTGDDGATPLHAAAAAGSAEVVRLLLARGADRDAADSTWHSPPIDWAIVGSGMHLGHNPHADWVATVQALSDAGLEQVSLGPDKPPSAEVEALLRAHGVR